MHAHTSIYICKYTPKAYMKHICIHINMYPQTCAYEDTHHTDTTHTHALTHIVFYFCLVWYEQFRPGRQEGEQTNKALHTQ